MDILHTINSILNWTATNVPWDLVIASGLLSPVLLVIKKKLDVQSEKVMMTLVLVLSTLGSAAQYLLTTTAGSPEIIAAHGLMVAALSQPWYFALYKPAMAWFSNELAKARAFDAEVKSAAIPATGLPTAETKV